MFFRFCSDRVYDRDRWPLVWEVERAVQSLILADLPSVRSASSDMLKSMILDLLHAQKIKFTTGNKRSDTQWVNAFLDVEIPHIREYLDGLPSDMCDFRGVSQIRDYGLMPNENLSRCMRDSDVFRTYIKESVGTT